MLACVAYAVGAAFASGFWRWLLMWPATVYLLITYCYAFDGSMGAQLLRKRAGTDGTGLPHYGGWRSDRCRRIDLLVQLASALELAREFEEVQRVI